MCVCVTIFNPVKEKVLSAAVCVCIASDVVFPRTHPAPCVSVCVSVCVCADNVLVTLGLFLTLDVTSTSCFSFSFSLFVRVTLEQVYSFPLKDT